MLLMDDTTGVKLGKEGEIMKFYLLKTDLVCGA